MLLTSTSKQKLIDTKLFQGLTFLSVLVLFGFFIYAVCTDMPYHPFVFVQRFLSGSRVQNWIAYFALSASYFFIGSQLMLLIDGRFRRRAEIAEAGSKEAYLAKKQKERDELSAAKQVQRDLRQKRAQEVEKVIEKYADLSDYAVTRLTLHRLEQIHALLEAQKPTSN